MTANNDTDAKSKSSLCIQLRMENLHFWLLTEHKHQKMPTRREIFLSQCKTLNKEPFEHYSLFYGSHNYLRAPWKQHHLRLKSGGDAEGGARIALYSVRSLPGKYEQLIEWHIFRYMGTKIECLGCFFWDFELEVTSGNWFAFQMGIVKITGEY